MCPPVHEHRWCFHRPAGVKFAGTNRLKTRRDFNRVFDQPKRIRNRDISLFARRNDLGLARLGLAVSRKVSRRAVVRNRIKRLIRESFRHQDHNLAGWDIIAVAHPPCAGQDSISIFDTLSSHWEKLKAT